MQARSGTTTTIQLSRTLLILQQGHSTHYTITLFSSLLVQNHQSTFCLYEFDYPCGTIQQYLSCWDYLTSLSILLSRYIHVVTSCVRISFTFTVEQYFNVRRYHISLTNFSIQGHLVCLYFWTSTNSTAANRSSQISLRCWLQFFWIYTQQ